MSAPDLTTGNSAAGIEMLHLDAFLDIIRHATRFMPESAAKTSPLDRAADKIERDPAFAQSRVLSRVLAALVEGGGQFRRADAAVFDAETLKLIVDLVRTKAVGTLPPAAWAATLNRARDAGVDPAPDI